MSNCCTTETEAKMTKEESNDKLTEVSPHTMKVQEVGLRGKRMKSPHGGEENEGCRKYQDTQVNISIKPFVRLQ